MSATGLALPEVSKLARPEKELLADWHLSKSGSNEGKLWLPHRIRSMPLATRMQLAADPDLDLAWEAREIRRIEESPTFFIREYGSIEPEEGEPIPFELWPEQIEVIEAFERHLRNVILKARQLGLTWLAVHYALWLMAFNKLTPNAKILALSKKGSDAEILLDRTRKVNERLPGFLRAIESYKTVESNTRFRLRDRGSEMRSLMGTPEAARSFTATFVIADEFGHLPNQKAQPTWTSLLPTLGEKGRVAVIFTGNGKTGNGAAAASLWSKSRSGLVETEGLNGDAPAVRLNPIFLPYTVHPARRRKGWRDAVEEDFLTLEEAHAEYPATEEEALAGAGSFSVYPHEGIDAALRLGGALEESGILEELVAAEGCEWGIDWGDFSTFAVYAVALPGGGLWIFDELNQSLTEPTDASEAIIYRDPARLRGVRFIRSFADSNPAGTNKTFARVLREAHGADPRRWPDAHSPVHFSKFKEGGGDRAGVNTVGYIVRLLNASAKFGGDPEEASGVLAISPRCKTLAAQMRNLERDADTGKVRKPALDPRQLERGDHGPDAVVALAATRAAKFRKVAT